MQARVALLACAAVTAVGACSSSDPERELTALVAAAEAAAEGRRTGFFRDSISAAYADPYGRSRDDLVDLIRGYFFVNADVDIVSRVESVTLAGEDAARMTIRAALVGLPDAGGLLAADAGLHRIDLELVREGGDWRVIGADWDGD